MARPQFTLRNMLASVTYLAVSLGFFRAAFVMGAIILCYFGLLFMGACIGTMLNSAREWTAAMAIIGLGLFFLLALVDLMTF